LLSATAYKHVIGVKYDPVKVGAALRPPLSDYLREAKNARWKVVGDKGRVLSSLSGIDLDARTTALHLTRAGAHAGSARVAALAFRVTQPELTTKAARALGATDVVAQATTSLGDSSPNRVFNVALLAKLLDGTIVKPGATFSFNGTVGKRTAERGFREGQAIENGVLVPSIGGGVCQAATTVFDAAFAGGYDITYRVNHSFYISHYPLGMDATVADTGPDFTFVNDSKNAIVIKATANPSTMTVVFLSRPLGRKVEQSRSDQTAFVEPKKRYYASPDVPAGTVQQTTLGERGFQVTVARTVSDADGTILHDDRFRSRYIPEDAIYLIGKGGKLPAGQTLAGLYPGYTGSTAGVNLAMWLAKPDKKPSKSATPQGSTFPGATGPNGATTTPDGTTTTPDGATTTPDGATTTADGATAPPAGQ
jgi:vancomycin resistance protein YoaR